MLSTTCLNRRSLGRAFCRGCLVIYLWQGMTLIVIVNGRGFLGEDCPSGHCRINGSCSIAIETDDCDNYSSACNVSKTNYTCLSHECSSNQSCVLDAFCSPMCTASNSDDDSLQNTDNSFLALLKNPTFWIIVFFVLLGALPFITFGVMFVRFCRQKLKKSLQGSTMNDPVVSIHCSHDSSNQNASTNNNDTDTSPEEPPCYDDACLGYAYGFDTVTSPEEPPCYDDVRPGSAHGFDTDTSPEGPPCYNDVCPGYAHGFDTDHTAPEEPPCYDDVCPEYPSEML